jgi:hypothetical protein
MWLSCFPCLCYLSLFSCSCHAYCAHILRVCLVTWHCFSYTEDVNYTTSVVESQVQFLQCHQLPSTLSDTSMAAGEYRPHRKAARAACQPGGAAHSLGMRGAHRGGRRAMSAAAAINPPAIQHTTRAAHHSATPPTASTSNRPHCKWNGHRQCRSKRSFGCFWGSCVRGSWPRRAAGGARHVPTSSWGCAGHHWRVVVGQQGAFGTHGHDFKTHCCTASFAQFMSG